jgi:murein L,D-transpeptidase YcbB/YkuD
MSAALTTGGCSCASTPTPPDASAALREIVDAKRAAFAPEDGDRGHHVWREEQRFYKQHGYQRWLPDDLGPRYPLVNIPAFRLDAIENGIPQDIVQKEILPNNNFLFPNHYNVYLHDTPAQALFNRVEREFSHGCVRLDEPMDLARYVLSDQAEWTDDKIAAAMQAGTERAVPLKQPLPICLGYFTAWKENGTLRTVPDVYSLDRRQATAANAQ